MVRQTSVEAYKTIDKLGLLSLRRWQVYHSLFVHGPLTGGEVFVKCRDEFPGQFQKMLNSNVITRLGELREMGVVKEIGEKKCSISGQNVILWDVTADLPRKLDQKSKPKDFRYVCLICGKSWPQFIEQKLQGRPQVHYDNQDQYCFGELVRYKRC